MNPVVAHGGDTLEKDLDERRQLLLRRLAPSGLDDGRGGRPHLIDRRLHDGVVQTALAVEVIVDGRDVRVRRAADGANGHLRKATRREQPRSFIEQPLPCVRIRGTLRTPHSLHLRHSASQAR